MTGQAIKTNEKWLYLCIILAVFLNFTGIFVTVMGPDGALYASISKTMVWRNNFVDLFVDGRDWLDKPHFPFWVVALSFKLFGITTWAYKLPGILFVLMGAGYTYQFALALYNKHVALWSVVILLTAQHILISNTDVRAEPYLTGLIIGSVYYFYRAQRQSWFMPLLLGSVFAACAVMTKGIFAVIPIAGAIIGQLLIHRDWRGMFHIKWLIAVVLVGVFILPEIWCLYQQFDMHPEKVVFGKTHVSGIKFFFWDSQFGRFFNNGPIKKSNGDLSFFVHTTLWAFLPWSLLLYIAIVQFFRSKVKTIQQKEWYCISGAGLTFLVFSVSKFQLPHYITIIFPFFAILTAQFILTEGYRIKWVRGVQIFVMSAMVLILCVLEYFFRPTGISPFAVCCFIAAAMLFIFFSVKAVQQYRVFFQTFAVALLVNLYFNLAYYPQLLRYQSDSTAAFWINKHNPSNLPLVQVKNGSSYGLDFYANQKVYPYRMGEKALLPKRPYLLVGERQEIEALMSSGLVAETLQSFEHFHITLVKPKFLNYKTRANELGYTDIVLVK
ncbi:MAG: glycosyl transferase [Pedobacter sp.]|nr:MAG: glycosyl transferase [Pedobacter sp.]